MNYGQKESQMLGIANKLAMLHMRWIKRWQSRYLSQEMGNLLCSIMKKNQKFIIYGRKGPKYYTRIEMFNF